MSTSRTAITIQCNGDDRRVAPEATVADLLKDLGQDPDAARGIAVAVNDAVVRRQDWAATPLHEADRVEVLTARQGG